jgi:predicted component of type VI protein secretion system
MKAKLIVVGGTTSTTEVDLRLPTIIGRGRTAQLTIPHSLVSRQHCEISESDGRLAIRDLNSLNGTYVGDERIVEAILEPGALLTVGTVTFRAAYEVGNCDESRLASADDTCRGDGSMAETIGPLTNESGHNVDHETVPIADCLLEEDVLPDHAVDVRETSSEEGIARMASHADEPALESVPPNSD